MEYSFTVLAAADYSCDTYGSGDYGNCNGSSQTGTLPDTGYDILLPLALGVSLIVASGIYFVRKFLLKKAR